MKTIKTLVIFIIILLLTACDNKKNPTAPDATTPIVTITTPLNNQQIIDSDTVRIELNATDDVGVVKVELFINSILRKAFTSPPYVFNWIVSGISDTAINTIYAKAYDSDGNVSTSKVVLLQINRLAPSNLEIYSLSGNSVKLNWKDNSAIENGFEVERSVNNTEFIKVADLLANTNVFVDNNLDSLNLYRYRIRAIHAGTKSGYSNEVKIKYKLNYDLLWAGNHYREVYSAQFSEDGSRLVSGSGDYTVKMWNAENGNLLWTGNHISNVTSVNFSPDDSKVVSGCWENQIKIWNAYTGGIIWSVENSNNVRSVKFSPDGSKIASAGNDSSVKMRNAENGDLIWDKKHSHVVFNVHFSPDGKRVVSASMDKTVKVWNASDGGLLWTGNHSSGVNLAIFSYQGDKVISAGDDNQVKIWDSENGALIWSGIHDGRIFSVDFSFDGEKVVSGSDDKTVKVWNATNGSLIWQGVHQDYVRSVSFSRDGSTTISGSSNGIKVWDSNNGELLWADDRFGGAVFFSADKSKIVLKDNTLKVLQLNNKWKMIQ